MVIIEEQEGKKFYKIQFGRKTIGRTRLGYYNGYVNPDKRAKEVDENEAYLTFLVQLGVIIWDDKEKQTKEMGTKCMALKNEAIDILAMVEGKLQEFLKPSIAEDDLDPRVGGFESVHWLSRFITGTRNDRVK